MRHFRKYWFLYIWFGITVFLFIIILFTSNEIDKKNLYFTANGLILFVQVYSIPLYFFAACIPIYGIILTIKRINATECQNRFVNFETTFFTLLELNANYSKELNIPGFGVNEKGGNSFIKLHSSFHDLFFLHKLENREDKLTGFREIFNRFLKDMKRGGPYLQIYLNNIKNIIFHIVLFENDIDKNKYGEILRSQLSKYELLLLLYYSISGLEKDLIIHIKSLNLLEIIEESEVLKVNDFDPYKFYKESS